MTTTERGKFFFNRDGKAVFWNRQHLLKAAASAASLSDTMTGLEYTYAGLDVLQNDIVVVCHPRVIGATDQEVLSQYTSNSPQKNFDSRLRRRQIRTQKTEIRKQSYPSLRSGRAGTAKTNIREPVACEAPVAGRTTEE